MSDFELKLGDKIRLPPCEIGSSDIVKYSCMSGDFNPLHFDHLFATARGLKGVIAHGMLSMGICAAGLATTLGPGFWIKAISSRFTSPVYAGKSIEIAFTVLACTHPNELQLAIRGDSDGNQVLTGSAIVTRV